MKKIFITLATTFICLSLLAQSYHYERVGGSNNSQQKVTRQTRSVNTQPETTAPKIRKRMPIEIGGNIGMSFGDDTHIVFAPTVGLQITPNFAVGAGVNYTYHKYDRAFEGDFNESFGGLSLYSRARFLDYIGAYVRPELNYSWGSYKLGGLKYDLDGKLVPSVVVGLGFYVPMGSGYMMVSGYYDIVQNDRSPYGKNIGCAVGYTYSF